MAVGLSIELYPVGPCGPGRYYMPPIHKRAFEDPSCIQQVAPILI